MLPGFVVDELLARGTSSRFDRKVSNVAVLFCDLCHFENWTVSLPASCLVSFLDRLFLVMDVMASRERCEKVETVGGTFLACSRINQLPSEPEILATEASGCVFRLAVAIVRAWRSCNPAECRKKSADSCPERRSALHVLAARKNWCAYWPRDHGPSGRTQATVRSVRRHRQHRGQDEAIGNAWQASSL